VVCASQSAFDLAIDSGLLAEVELAVMHRSNREVNKAGDYLRGNPPLSDETSQMLMIVSDWRSEFEYSLSRVMTTLRKHTNAQGWKGAIISGRTKRLRSIIAKLGRQSNMDLTQMQDIGGCRAVMKDVDTAECLAESIRSHLHSKVSAGGKSTEDNYISSPKPDGYRSIHFVVRHQSNPGTHAPDQKPRRIEIQIRSIMQHRWATALETVDLFSSQTLKTGGGDIRWRRFFALSSGFFAMMENRPTVPGTPADSADLRKEMMELAKELRVVDRLQHWSKIMEKVLTTKKRDLEDRYTYLIELDVDAGKTNVTAFPPELLSFAHKRYLESEKENTNYPNRSTVLVKAHSFKEVQQAYPGFYGDTEAFLYATELVRRGK
jgi:ppGpp synthetase/RelA/SpoT-type nucleotidyltranferase